jgi:hypothetical protein
MTFGSWLVVAVPVRAEGGDVWHLAATEAPAPPAGIAPAPYPVPLGAIGAISFWAPNRGLLITGGTEAAGGPVAPGLYAYNGASWHQLSTVCGGGEGRIAWAGPDEFWTISDQRAGQLVEREQSASELQVVSLCHFLDGQVIGSYAMPLEQPNSYLKMDAAACYGPSDCWFGGKDGRPPNFGSFHLHWDGTTVSTVYEPDDHAVTDMINFAGRLYESVQLEAGDIGRPGEGTSHPPLLHAIAQSGSEPFSEAPIISETSGRLLPEYGEEVSPLALQGFDLASDGSPLGVGSTQLWAAANPTSELPAGSKAQGVTILREAGGRWAQLAPNADGESALPHGVELAGAERTQVGEVFNERGASGALAPEPGSESAWLSVRVAGVSGAELVRLGVSRERGVATGELLQADVLPEADEPVGPRGEAGPVTCPAPHDCWMATTEGWIFHFGGNGGYAVDTDPSFDGVISYRPPDSGVPAIYPDVPPADDSLANQQQSIGATGSSSSTPARARARKASKPLVRHVTSRLVDHRVLVIAFTLSSRAYVQLVARRRRHVVAETRKESLRAGRHRLSLNLNAARWPTGLQFKATPAAGHARESEGSNESSSGNTVTTG